MTPEQNAVLKQLFDITAAPGPRTVKNAIRQIHRLLVRHHLQAGIALPPPLARFALMELEAVWRANDNRSAAVTTVNQRRSPIVKAKQKNIDRVMPHVAFCSKHSAVALAGHAMNWLRQQKPTREAELPSKNAVAKAIRKVRKELKKV